VTKLAEALEQPETRTEAVAVIRSLVDAIVLMPEDGAVAARIRAGRPSKARADGGADASKGRCGLN
jgi:hypothetical protein